MEDVVAVRLTLESGEARYFLTWGRIQDVVDPAELERVVLDSCTRYSLDGRPVSAAVCGSLGEARDEPYFYEAFWELSQTRIPFGRRYPRWRRRIEREMSEGEHLWYLGR